MRLVLLLLAILAAAPAGAEDLSAIARTEGQALVDALGHQTGLSIGLVTPKETSSVHVAAAGGPVPTDRTLYEIGSNTKIFTATILAHAVVEGRLRLDDPIAPHLPGAFPNLGPVRVVHLTNLTSGLPNWLPDPAPALRDRAPEQIPDALIAQHAGYDRTKFYADLAKASLAGQPGTTPRHSNVAAQLLADILERLYGTSSDALLARYITRPLGMRDTGFNSGGATMRQGHDSAGRKMWLVSTMPDMTTAGGLRSTTHDMQAFVRHQLDPRDAAIRLSHETTVRASNDAIALNWHVDHLKSGEIVLWHTGGTFGFSSYIALYPARGLGLVLMIDESDPTTQTKLAAIASKIESAYAR